MKIQYQISGIDNIIYFISSDFVYTCGARDDLRKLGRESGVVLNTYISTV